MANEDFQFQSVHEMRRKAPFHFIARAENARFAAYMLSHADTKVIEEMAVAASYGMTPSVAAHEAFCREASFAIESVIKAVILLRLQWGLSTVELKANHALDQLWKDANLPSLSRDEMYWLLRAKRILYWAGRYAAPLRDADFDREEREIEKYKRFEMLGGLKIFRSSPFSWDGFENLYAKANTEFWMIQNEMSP